MSGDEVFEYGYRNGRQLKHFLVDVTAAGYDHLLRVTSIVFSDVAVYEYTQDSRAATHVLIDGARQLTFFRSYTWPARPSGYPPGPFDAVFDRLTALPAPASAEQAATMAWEWLAGVAYPPDEHDGSSYKGWRAFNQQFGIVGGHWEAFLAIRPQWIYLPK